MVEPPEDLRFLGKPTEQVTRPEAGPQHLHGDLAISPVALPLVDASHPPFAEDAHEPHPLDLTAEERVGRFSGRGLAQLPQGFESEAVRVGKRRLDLGPGARVRVG
jgi:hypothetical protein